MSDISLSISLKNCYGIGRMKKKFDFTTAHKCVSIYAPNGSMKTSFAKTMLQIQHGKLPEDLLDPDADVFASIKVNGEEISSDSIFVVQSLDHSFRSKSVNALMLNREMREQYLELVQDRDQIKEEYLRQLRQFTGLVPARTESLVGEIMVRDPSKFFAGLASAQYETSESDGLLWLANIKFNAIFNDDTEKIINDQSFRQEVEMYTARYDQLLSKSRFFRRGIFNHTNAEVVAKNLNQNGFFKAKHRLILLSRDDSEFNVSTEADLAKYIEQEKEDIINDETLRKSFDRIDRKFSNVALKEFREMLTENPEIIKQLAYPERLRRNLLVSYFAKTRDKYDEVLKTNFSIQDRLRELTERAQEERSIWDSVIDIYNRRFAIPFTVTVNVVDVRLTDSVPEIKFFQTGRAGETPVERDVLYKTLSGGELRALYLLDIIFEIEARKQSGQDTIFVFDDIADSFDYKNKYAILEYLIDIKKCDSFVQIFMTHNFDFYRSYNSRLALRNNRKFIAEKIGDTIFLNASTLPDNPLASWKSTMGSNNSQLIASIPFFRNICQYVADLDNAEFLTSCLHLKENTSLITISFIQKRINSILKDRSIKFHNDEALYLTVLFDICRSLVVGLNSGIKFEEKIVLAIGVRLKVEEYIMNNVDVDTSAIEESQTRALTRIYLEQNPSLGDESRIVQELDKVNLITPEHLHVNSFMYEPLIDIDPKSFTDMFQYWDSL